MWGSLNGRELANLFAAELAEASRVVNTWMALVRHQSLLHFASLKHRNILQVSEIIECYSHKDS